MIYFTILNNFIGSYMYPIMQESKKINTQLPEINQNNKHYLNTILNKSDN